MSAYREKISHKVAPGIAFKVTMVIFKKFSFNMLIFFFSLIFFERGMSVHKNRPNEKINLKSWKQRSMKKNYH
jgi:hypothetical protein